MSNFQSSYSSEELEQAIGSALLNKKAYYNITQDKGSNYSTLSEAIGAVSDNAYKVNGLVLAFYNGTDWVEKRFNGTGLEEFTDESKWIDTCCGGEVAITEKLSITLSSNQAQPDAGLNGAKVTITWLDVTKEHTWNGTEIVEEIPLSVEYTITFGAIQGYSTPESKKFTSIAGNVRNVEVEYTKIVVDVITVNQTISDSETMVGGDVNGEVIQWIKANSHRVLAKKTAEGKVTYCRLKDDDGTKYHDGSASNLTGAEGDVFVKLPTFHYAGNDIGDGTSGDNVEMRFSKEPFENSIEWDTNILIGAYESVMSENKAYSKSGVESTGRISQRDWGTYAAARGTGYQLVDWQMHCVLGCLYYAMYGNTDCQSTIGKGTNSYQKINGETDALGMTDTVAGGNGDSGSINFWGLENWWGNKYECIEDYENAAGTLVATVNDPVNGGTRRLDIPSAGYTGYYPKKMKFGRYLDLVATDDDPKNGSNSVGYCDYQWWPDSTSSSTRVVRRSYYYSYTSGGVAYAAASYDSSGANSNSGSRLAFRGECTEAESVAAFKALPVL